MYIIYYIFKAQVNYGIDDNIKAEAERAQAEEQRIKKQKAMETVIEQFKVYLEGMKKEIKENEKGIESAKAEELEIIDASEKESAINEEKKAAAYRERDEANESITNIQLGTNISTISNKSDASKIYVPAVIKNYSISIDKNEFNTDNKEIASL